MSDAEANCRRRLDAFPNFSEAHNALGVVLEQERRLPDAEAAFVHAIDLKGENVEALYNLGNVYAQTERPRHAAEMYRRALTLLPEFVEAHTNLGVVLMNTERLAEAEASLRQALALNPQFSSAARHLDGLLAKRTRGHAIDVRPGVDSAAESLQALLDRGAGLARAGRTNEAEHALRAAIEAHPNVADPLDQLCQLLVSTSRSDEAQVLYRRAIELKGDSAELQFNLGIVLVTGRKLAQARRAYGAAVIRQPDFPQAVQNLRFTGREIERHSKAVARCRDVIAGDRADAEAHHQLGVALMALGRDDDAIQAFKEAIAVDADHAGAYRNLGNALFAQKQRDAAIQFLTRAIALEPDYAQAMADVAGVHLAGDEFAQSRRWGEAALSIEPRHRSANGIMASVLMRTNRGQEATPYLDRAAAKPPVYIEYATNPARTVLILWTDAIGNIPTLEFLLPLTSNSRVNWVVQSGRTVPPDDLPHHDLVFNATGDADVAKESVGPIERFARRCRQPLLNRPENVARTARHELPALLQGIANIVVPPVWRFATAADWPQSIAEQLPVLIRPVDSHGGRDLVRVETVEQLSVAKAAQSAPLYATRFVDFRSADGWFRKFRIVFIDRQPLPLHLAISQHWLIHYATADMQAHPWKLAEETRFLEDQATFLGAGAIAAIRAIGERLDLDYAGIDFSLLADGRVLVFEANPTMLVHTEPIGSVTDHKNQFVFRIQARFEDMLQKRSAQLPR